MNRNLAAHLAVLFANIIYGANYSIAKSVMPEFILPFGFIVIRVVVSACLFSVVAFLFRRERIERHDLFRLFLCAVFGVAVNQLLFFKGLSLTSPINSGLIMVTNPLFVLLLSSWYLRERITLRKALGVFAGLTGATLLIRFGHLAATGSGDPVGDLCILINSFSYAVYLVMVIPLMRKYHPLTIMAVVFAFGSLLVLPFGWSEFQAIDWNSFTPEVWWSTVFVVIGTTFFAYLFNTLALQELSPGIVSVYIYLQPLLAVGFSILLGKDTPHLLHLISGILILAGVRLTTSQVAVRPSPKE
ncbi:MAG: DMT family transporter [Bacteroidota bacterium]